MAQSEMAFRELRANGHRKGDAIGGGRGEKMLSLQRSGHDTYVTYFWREVTLIFSVRGASFARIFSPYISSFITNLGFT